MSSYKPIPKAELHLHIEGTLEPDLAFALAERNGVALTHADALTLRKAYAFEDLQSFLNLYYELMSVLVTEDDFEALAEAYLQRAAQQGVRHAEIFFDPQAHTARGVSFGTVIRGLHRALARSEERHGISTRLIMSFLRDRPVSSALDTLAEAQPYLELITGVGLDSAEVGHPPELFTEVYARAAALGLRRVAHAGEEGGPEYVSGALDALGVERIDHGLRAFEDPALTARLVREAVPLTVCPLSNVRLRTVDTLEKHPLRAMLDAGLKCTVNSDDPSYFGGYADDNYTAVRDALGLSSEELRTLARNSFEAAFLEDDEERRSHYLAAVAAHRF